MCKHECVFKFPHCVFFMDIDMAVFILNSIGSLWASEWERERETAFEEDEIECENDDSIQCIHTYKFMMYTPKFFNYSEH